MQYYVTYRMEARYVTAVEADSIEEAKTMAEEHWLDADFGEAEDIEGEPIVIEEDDDIVWEK